MSDKDDSTVDFSSDDNAVGGEITVGSSVQFSLASSSVTAETLGIGLDKMSEDTLHRQYEMQADKRAHHNALERKRRDHIKDSFSALRDSVPTIAKDKLSRAQILKKAADYIDFMIRKNATTRSTLDNLRQQNKGLEQQLMRLEKLHKGSAAESSEAARSSGSGAESSWRTQQLPGASSSRPNKSDSSDDDRSRSLKRPKLGH